MSAEKAIYAILKADSNTNTTASGGIYADIATQGETPPFIVYRLTDVTPEPTKDGVSDFDKFELEIAAIADEEQTADTLAGYIKTAVDDYSGTIAGVTISGTWFMEKRAYFDQEGELFIREQDFEIIVKT